MPTGYLVVGHKFPSRNIELRMSYLFATYDAAHYEASRVGGNVLKVRY